MLTTSNHLTLALCLTLFSNAYSGRISTIVIDSSYEIGLTAWDVSFATISWEIGAFVGALLIWPFAIFLSRKRCIYIGMGVTTLSIILELSSLTVAVLQASQAFSGLANSLITSACVLYQTEMACAHNRGKRVAIIFAAYACGTALGSWLDFAFYFVGYTPGGVKWRVPIALQLILLLIALGALYKTPESWRWLVTHNRPDHARKVLDRVQSQEQYGSSSEESFQFVLSHYRQCSNSSFLCSCCSRRRRSRNLPDRGPVVNLRSGRRLFLACLLQVMTPLTAITVANYYRSLSTNFFINNNYISLLALRAGLVTVFFVFALLPIPLIDRLGRRTLLMISTLGLAGCFLAATIAGSFGTDYTYDTYMTHSTAIAYFTIFFIAQIFYSLTLRYMAYLYAAEIGPSLSCSNDNSKIMAISVALGVGFELMMAFVALRGNFYFGFYFFLLWMGLNLLWAAVVFLFVPETAGRTLEDVDMWFSNNGRLFLWNNKDARRVWRGQRSSISRNNYDGEGPADDRAREMVLEPVESTQVDTVRQDAVKNYD